MLINNKFEDHKKGGTKKYKHLLECYFIVIVAAAAGGGYRLYNI